jgi:MFS transporter, DHA1 family, tetracycline resistance protein
VTTYPTSKLAITFVFITVLVDMIDFGLIIPVEPALIKKVGDIDVAHALLIGGWLFAAFSVTHFLF